MVCIVISIAVVACGAKVEGDGQGLDPGKGDGPGEGSGGDDGGAAPLTPSTFLVGVGHVECDHAFLCRDSFPEDDFGEPFEAEFGNTADECYVLANQFYRPDEVQQSADQGRIVFDADEAQLCVDGITFPAECDVYWQVGPDFPEACDDALLGQVQDGDFCTTDFDCESSDCSEVCVP